MQGKTYKVKVVKGRRSGDNVLYVDGYSLIFETKKRPWFCLVLSIEPQIVEELKKAAKEKGMLVGDFLMQIIRDEGIPQVDIPREKSKRKKKCGININRMYMEELKKMKEGKSLHGFVVSKLYGWYFSRGKSSC